MAVPASLPCGFSFWELCVCHFKKCTLRVEKAKERAGEGPRQATTLSELQQRGVTKRLLQREEGTCSRLALSAALQHWAAARWPAVLQEAEVQCIAQRGFDKAFASEWLNPRWAVIGTKCNRLLLVDTTTTNVVEVPLPKNVSSSVQPPIVNPVNPYPHCGIHAVACSPCGTMLATGGDRPEDCQVFRITGEGEDSRPELVPACILSGHEDWLFGVAWISNQHIVTGSRDRTIKLWSVREEGGLVTQPLVSRLKKDKIRDVKFNQDTRRLASINPNGKVTLWDPNLIAVRSTKLGGEREVVCLAMKHDLIAVGSQRQVTLLDPRLKRPGLDIKNVETADVDAGVRSIHMTETLLSYGTGHGRIAFHDLRKADMPLIDLEGRGCINKESTHTLESRTCMEVGNGWLDENEVYRQYFCNERPKNAIYSHSWSPGGNRLLAVGGPLAYGLKGCYMGIWD